MENKIISVSELTFLISSILEENLPYISVQGEISNYKKHSSGHQYFTLKDENAQISCVIWRGKSINLNLSDGMKVVIEGRLVVYPPQGKYQIECDKVRPKGIGDLYIKFEQLKQKLQEAGYFDSSRKRQLPQVIMNIGVSTSPTGAAVRDIFSTLERRFPLAKIYFRPTLVQGDGSANDICLAIDELNKCPVDVIIIGRGGGSLEDLWSFNTENVANAIFNSPKPIVSAVGHETDFTIADFVADLRAATPTAAAELVSPITVDYLNKQISNLAEFLERSILNKVDNLKEFIEELNPQNSLKRILDRLKVQQQRIDEFQIRLERTEKRLIESKKQKINGLNSHLLSLNPYSPLNKGYALLKHKEHFINLNESLKKYDEFEIIRKNEIVNACLFNSLNMFISQPASKKKNIKKKIENTNELF
ncbi:MAG TPA: exodeoxyribonuclease VII large subunit [Candidatus Kapabacteria bacterium]|nr:exodeoxyribonuclease VII large subunit [Candidatus Kapabacteria bacterium]HPO62016.1 exodeoxyribonuclease VII large subunit [Candidatus Kapabacteria bacterium]